MTEQEPLLDMALNAVIEALRMNPDRYTTNNIGSESDPRGIIFVKDVSSAYEIGTKKSGDVVLAPREI